MMMLSLFFIVENQAVRRAGIKFSDFLEKNPNIYLSYDHENWEFANWNLFDFLTTEVFHQALFGFPFNAHCNDIGDEKEIYVRKNWKQLELKSNLWATEFFQNSPDEILALIKSKNQVDLFIATKSENHFNELDEKTWH